MPRGIDHIVHAVHDLDKAAAFYRGLGFTVGGRNRHPRDWGTQNRIIQTPETFIELLAIDDASGIAPAAPHYFSFGAFNRDFLKSQEGLSMLVLKGRGAPDAAEFRAKGIGDFALYDFEREGRGLDGTTLRFAFTLAFAVDPHAPDVGFFTCQHRHPPENFWNPQLQKHANGTTATAGVVLVAADPERHRVFLEAFADAEASRGDDGFSMVTPRGSIEMLTPAAFTGRYGVAAPDTARGARLAAIRFTVADASLLQDVPELAGIAGIYEKNTAIVGADDAFGAVMVFEPGR
ncbi:MAG TPA: VOC family protein [Pseudolabrys sp.]|nr:VOC family protein [Pseudolabrys sp.]